VAAVEGSISEGYRPVDMVAPALRAELAAQKKGDKIAQELAAKNLTSVEAYAETMGSSVDSVKVRELWYSPYRWYRYRTELERYGFYGSS